MIASNAVLLKWTYNAHLLSGIYRRLDNTNNFNENDAKTSKTSPNLSELSELLRRLSFQLYLKEKQSNSTFSATMYQRKPLRPFRIISPANKLESGSQLFKYARRQLAGPLKAYLVQDDDARIQFEYNLANLLPTTEYKFELSARLFNLESLLTKAIAVKIPLSKIFIVVEF